MVLFKVLGLMFFIVMEDGYVVMFNILVDFEFLGKK